MKKFWPGWPSGRLGNEIRSLALAILFALTIRWALVEAYVIPSGSMQPTLLVHDHIFVNKIIYGVHIPFLTKWITRWRLPQRGEVIVFRHPDDESTFLIKRVIGLPGDKIQYDGTKLVINDKQIELREPLKGSPAQWDFDWLGPEGLDPDGTKYARFVENLGEHPHALMHITLAQHPPADIVVPEGRLFVMGDNRDDSNDSRFWGTVPMDNVLGRAMFIWLSCHDAIPVVGICSPLSLRWSRFFHSVK